MKFLRTAVICVFAVVSFVVSTQAEIVRSEDISFEMRELEVKGRPAFVGGYFAGVTIPISYPDNNLTTGVALGVSIDYLFGRDRTFGIWSEFTFQTVSSEAWDKTVDIPNLLANGESNVYTNLFSFSLGPEFALAPFGRDKQRLIFRVGGGMATVVSDEKFMIEGFSDQEKLTLFEYDKWSYCYQASLNIELGRRLNIPWEIAVQYFVAPEAKYLVRDGIVEGELSTVRVILVGTKW